MKTAGYYILAIALIFSSTASADKLIGEWAIAIHGGAGSTPVVFTDEENRARRAGMERALAVGIENLRSGTSALETVVAVVRVLEDHPLYNAGKGAVCNATGGHELDASLMAGAQRWGGGVAGLTTVKNPILLARKVMTETKLVLLAGEGAERFADEMQVERVDNSYFTTAGQREKFQKWKRKQDRPLVPDFGTVGCVALGADGNLAAGTSTGGLTGKKYGRVGDTPILGAGTYADNATCAVSCTGVGEHFIRLAAAYDVSAEMKYNGASVAKAVRHVLKEKMDSGWGGMIAVDRDGHISMQYTTDDMARAAANSSGRREVHWYKPIDLPRNEAQPAQQETGAVQSHRGQFYGFR